MKVRSSRVGMGTTVREAPENATQQVSPMIDRMYSDFVLTNPAQRPLRSEDHLFLQEIRAELGRLVEPA